MAHTYDYRVKIYIFRLQTFGHTEGCSCQSKSGISILTERRHTALFVATAEGSYHGSQQNVLQTLQCNLTLTFHVFRKQDIPVISA